MKYYITYIIPFILTNMETLMPPADCPKVVTDVWVSIKGCLGTEGWLFDPAAR